MGPFCVTRALKNARRIQSVAPHIIPAKEPLEGFSSLVPLDILSRFHLMRDADLIAHPQLLEVARILRQTENSVRPSGGGWSSLFQGTVHLVQLKFFEEADGSVHYVPDADMSTALQYTTLAAKPISAYASQYGQNRLDVAPNFLQYGIATTSLVYNDDAVQNLVNAILQQNNLPSESTCLVIFNPPGAINTDADPTQGVEGYHSMANSAYCFVNVFGNSFTIQDLPDQLVKDHYALVLSHEIAEMTVDPDGSSNPEVCDPCGPNCGRVWRDYFKVPSLPTVDSYLITTQTWPPNFDYTFFINAMVQPSAASDCPASEAACAYGPPPSEPGQSPSDMSYLVPLLL